MSNDEIRNNDEARRSDDDPGLSSILRLFAGLEEQVKKSPWFDDEWSCCSGLWTTKRYGDTALLRLTKRNWSSVFPVTLYSGGEIQYAAWVDEKLLRKSMVEFEMHVFGFPKGTKLKKSNFANAFRTRNQSAIDSFGFHHAKRGPAVPYSGSYVYKDTGDLADFILGDFSNFASLSGSVDQILAEF